MTTRTLEGLNLNLLIALDALLRENSVTRAAARIGVSQSAMSQSLGRLRAEFGDELLVRGSGGMVPTPLAAELAAGLRRALEQLERAINPSAVFDQSSSTRTFVFASEDALVPGLPLLYERLSIEAPNVRLEYDVASSDSLPHLLESGAVDVAAEISMFQNTGLVEHRLGTVEFASVVREDHPGAPAAGQPFALDVWCALGHVLVGVSNPGSASVVDEGLRAQGLERKIAVRVRSFVGAALFVANTDLVWNAPRGIAEVLARSLPLRVCEPPVPVPRHDIYAYWHRRYAEDAGHRWFRERVLDVLTPMFR